MTLDTVQDATWIDQRATSVTRARYQRMSMYNILCRLEAEGVSLYGGRNCGA